MAQVITPKAWSFSNKALRDCLESIKKKAKIIRTYDVPLLAGYSSGDDNEVYIDKSYPDGFQTKYKGWCPAIDFIIFHEGLEKALIYYWDMLYEPAHEIAQRCEFDAVEIAGFDPKEVNGFNEKYIRIARNKEKFDLPPHLDMKAYAKEKELLEKMKR